MTGIDRNLYRNEMQSTAFRFYVIIQKIERFRLKEFRNEETR